MGEIGKILIGAGIVILAAGLSVSLTGTVPFIGKLPGDILVRREGFTFYFPFTTSIILSVLLTVVMWLFRR